MLIDQPSGIGYVDILYAFLGYAQGYPSLTRKPMSGPNAVNTKVVFSYIFATLFLPTFEWNGDPLTKA